MLKKLGIKLPIKRPNHTKYHNGDKLGPKQITLIKRIDSIKGIFICPYCGKQFESRYQTIAHDRGDNCGCHRRCLETPKNANNLTGQRFGKLVVLEDDGTRKYRDNGNRVEILWKCKCDCGNIHYVLGYKLKNGMIQSCGCMRSRGESKITRILQSLDISFKKEKTFNDCINPKTGYKLRFDFYLPDYNTCIEYDGEQHFIESSMCQDSLKERQYKDNIKNQYCKDNSIKLLRISYIEYNMIEKILKEEFN